MERPLRLHSQLLLKAIQGLRYASGDEELRAALHKEFGDEIFTQFSQFASAVEKILSTWGRRNWLPL